MYASISAVMIALSVACGAFGSHALRDRLTPDLLRAFEIGTHYHLVQSVALLILALYLKTSTTSGLQVPFWILLIGTVIFSGSLYILALSGIRWFGAITPIGGTMIIAGWLYAAYLFLRPSNLEG